MICGVSFIVLESPVWHVCYVLMLLQPYINKSFNDGIVLTTVNHCRDDVGIRGICAWAEHGWLG